jgi:hypothetical protein
MTNNIVIEQRQRTHNVILSQAAGQKLLLKAPSHRSITYIRAGRVVLSKNNMPQIFSKRILGMVPIDTVNFEERSVDWQSTHASSLTC